MPKHTGEGPSPPALPMTGASSTQALGATSSKPLSSRKKGKTSPTAAAPSTLQPTAYRMHVSQRYLDLTRQKLDLIRLPREPRSSRHVWDHGVSKPLLESLIDHWVEHYNWREQETLYNDALPQFRLLIDRTRLHFVHKRSESPNAIPLLFITAWPDSFLGVAHAIDALSNPISSPSQRYDHLPSFHVVCPSIPGFGFSDPVVEESNNVQATAAFFDKLMRSLGYQRYLVHGSGWALKICRILALHFDSVIAIHTVDPDFSPPANFAFGSSPSGHSPVIPSSSSSPTSGHTPPLSRPQTVSYGLTDSPAGLLAYMVDAIQPPQPLSTAQSPMVVKPSSTPITERSSPRSITTASTSTAPSSTQGESPQSIAALSLAANMRNPWSETNMITWTMMYWLPGPEVPLRWLSNSASMESLLWTSTSPVPLGITRFREPNSGGSSPAAAAAAAQMQAQWAEMYHRVAMVRRREGRVRLAAWERPNEVVRDIRELAGIVAGAQYEQQLPLPPPMFMPVSSTTSWQN